MTPVYREPDRVTTFPMRPETGLIRVAYASPAKVKATTHKCSLPFVNPWNTFREVMRLRAWLNGIGAGSLYRCPGCKQVWRLDPPESPFSYRWMNDSGNLLLWFEAGGQE